jgi:hypothetical protein
VGRQVERGARTGTIERSVAADVHDAAAAPAQVIDRALPPAHRCQDTAMAERRFVVPWHLRARLRLEMAMVRAGQPLLRAGVNVLFMVEGPRLHVDAERAAAYDALLAAGGEIDYRLPNPRHEFLSYAVERHGLLAHGTNAPDIEEFEPRPANEAGAVQLGVHGASDGIWPMYFATVARGRRPGPLLMSNGCHHVGSGDRPRRYYSFAISNDPDDADSWTDGTVYLLPRATFRRLRGEEWLSEVPVRPVARLRVTPDDFPFRHSTALIRWPEPIGRARRRFWRRHRQLSAERPPRPSSTGPASPDRP